MIILITGPEETGMPGGIQTHIRNFLSAFDGDSDVQLRFYSTTKGLYQSESWFKKIISGMSRILPFLKEINGASAVHINSTFDNRSVIRDAVYLGLTLLRRKPVLVQFHGGRPLNVKALDWLLAGRLFKWLYSQAGIAVLSSAQERDLLKKIPDARIQIIPNYIQVMPLNKQYGRETVNFLYLGRLAEEKGVVEIVNVSEKLAEAGYRISVTICGDGPLKEWLENWLNNNPDCTWIKYLGLVRGDEKTDVLLNADVMLLPTRHAEGFPYSLLEAFANGISVIATGEGALQDVIRNGENGFLISGDIESELYCAMEQYCKDSSLVKTLGKSAYENIERNYSLTEMKRNFGAVYGELTRVES